MTLATVQLWDNERNSNKKKMDNVKKEIGTYTLRQIEYKYQREFLTTRYKQD